MDVDLLPAGLGQRVADPRLRGQVPRAVLDRPLDDTVGRDLWQQVARCLESTSAAVARAQEGAAPATVTALVSWAVDDTVAALAPLSEHPEVSHPRPEARLAPRPSARRVQVERTWFRLAGLLLGPSPADPVLLATVLADHATGLARWRQVLRTASAPARTALPVAA